jgi:hypothetical protein
MNRQEIKRHDELPVAFGNVCLGENFVLEDHPLTYLIEYHVQKGKTKNSFEIHPNSGEIWAFYKGSSMLKISVASFQRLDEDSYHIVSPLVRIEGFVSLFSKALRINHMCFDTTEGAASIFTQYPLLQNKWK